MIQEVAETQAGGPENLRKAVVRGAVKVAKTATGIEMYFFPSLHCGKKQSGKRTTSGTIQKESTDTAFEAFDDLIDNMSWQVDGSQCDTSEQHLMGEEAGPKEALSYTF